MRAARDSDELCTNAVWHATMTAVGTVLHAADTFTELCSAFVEEEEEEEENGFFANEGRASSVLSEFVPGESKSQELLSTSSSFRLDNVFDFGAMPALLPASVGVLYARM